MNWAAPCHAAAIGLRVTLIGECGLRGRGGGVNITTNLSAWVTFTSIFEGARCRTSLYLNNKQSLTNRAALIGSPYSRSWKPGNSALPPHTDMLPYNTGCSSGCAACTACTIASATPACSIPGMCICFVKHSRGCGNNKERGNTYIWRMEENLRDYYPLIIHHEYLWYHIW